MDSIDKKSPRKWSCDEKEYIRKFVAKSPSLSQIDWHACSAEILENYGTNRQGNITIMFYYKYT